MNGNLPVLKKIFQREFYIHAICLLSLLLIVSTRWTILQQKAQKINKNTATLGRLMKLSNKLFILFFLENQLEIFPMPCDVENCYNSHGNSGFHV